MIPILSPEWPEPACPGHAGGNAKYTGSLFFVKPKFHVTHPSTGVLTERPDRQSCLFCCSHMLVSSHGPGRRHSIGTSNPQGTPDTMGKKREKRDKKEKKSLKKGKKREKKHKKGKKGENGDMETEHGMENTRSDPNGPTTPGDSAMNAGGGDDHGDPMETAAEPQPVIPPGEAGSQSVGETVESAETADDVEGMTLPEEAETRSEGEAEAPEGTGAATETVPSAEAEPTAAAAGPDTVDENGVPGMQTAGGPAGAGTTDMNDNTNDDTAMTMEEPEKPTTAAAPEPEIDLEGEASGAYGFFTDVGDGTGEATGAAPTAAAEPEPTAAAEPEVDLDGEASGAYGFFTDVGDEAEGAAAAEPEIDLDGEASGAYGFFNDDDEETDGDAETLVLSGDLTIQRAKALKEEFVTAIANNRNLVVDLDGASNLDLSFLQILCSAHRALLDSGKTLRIARPVPDLFRQTVILSGFSGCAGTNDKSDTWGE